MVSQQPGGQAPVLRGLGMPDRLDRVSVPGEPPSSQLVQCCDFPRFGVAQLQLQQVSEEMVIPEPGPRRVQRHHERVRLFQILQHALPARASGQQVGKLAVDPLQDTGPQQQPPDVLTLPIQHLGQQVFGHRPLGAGELFGEPLRIRVPGQRQRRQPQPRRPPFSPVHQLRHRRSWQIHSGRDEQGLRLGDGEPQIVRADLGQLPL